MGCWNVAVLAIGLSNDRNLRPAATYVKYISAYSIPVEGRYLGRFGARGGSGARGRGADVALRTREALGNRPGPLMGLCLQWLDGTGEGWGNLPGWRVRSRPRPEARSQGQKSQR